MAGMMNWRFLFVQRFEIHGNECHQGLSGKGKDPHIVMFVGLAPHGDMKTCTPTEDNQVQDGNMGMIRGKGADMQKHSEVHLVGDHVVPIGMASYNSASW